MTFFVLQILGAPCPSALPCTPAQVFLVLLVGFEPQVIKVLRVESDALPTEPPCLPSQSMQSKQRILPHCLIVMQYYNLHHCTAGRLYSIIFNIAFAFGLLNQLLALGI